MKNNKIAFLILIFDKFIHKTFSLQPYKTYKPRKKFSLDQTFLKVWFRKTSYNPRKKLKAAKNIDTGDMILKRTVYGIFFICREINLKCY